jgi:HK97 family phage portal protein
MRIFGLTIGRSKATQARPPLAPAGSGSWWGWGWGAIKESFAGAWQRNILKNPETVCRNTTVFACVTLIASDIAKLKWKLTKPYKPKSNVWVEWPNSAYDPVLNDPNHYQNQIQFREFWLLSKLTTGNTYVLKERDASNKVRKLYILDPRRVFPMVSDDGSVYYELYMDNLNNVLPDKLLVPASEIIHDRFNCLFHPLIGLSPLFAAALPAYQANTIMGTFTNFFRNGAMPSGILTAPGTIKQETADRLKADWDKNYTGEGAGGVAVLGDNLKFEKISMTAADAQVIEQMRFSDEKICSAYHVPGYKVGVGAYPNYGADVAQQDYYNTCLQTLIEAMELCMDEGLSLPSDVGLCLDIRGLLRMDAKSLMTFVAEGVKASVLSPNDGREYFDLIPVTGGDSPMIQQQNYSLEAIAKRDAQPDPFITAKPTSVPEGNIAEDTGGAAAAGETTTNNADENAANEGKFLEALTKAFEMEMAA